MKLVKEVPMSACRACMDEEKSYCDHDGAKLTRKHVLILPGCCEASREALFPRVGLDYESIFAGEPDDTSKLKAVWTIPLASFYDDRVQQAWQGTDYKLPPPPTHCPFCGTGLPEIVRDPAPPSPIDSHDDCGHCGCGWPRSYGMCACWPRSAVFTTEKL